MCPIDQYKISNDGNYRSLFLFHYRISYVIRKDEIEILRIRHTSMKPKSY
ncbi:type II toxin-antitoxin system RelE/ParE family toxin [Flavipsychrobacter stenotrophus]